MSRTCLLVSPAFFGYERSIADSLTRAGYDVQYLDERPTNSALMRAVVRVRPGLIRRRIRRHFDRWSSQTAHQRYDLVVVIKAEVVPRSFLADLRARNPHAKFVFYTFDSLANSRQCLEVVDLFDVRYSFDRSDVENDRRFEYLPLFYTGEFEAAAPTTEPEWSVSFVGTLHSDRYATVNHVAAFAPKPFMFFYVQARWYFFLTKYITREFAHVPWNRVSFATLSRDDVATLFKRSRAVLDIQRNGQAGLTMRTFEVLAAGSILVTTNASIEREEFFDPDRILVLPQDLATVEPEDIQRRLDQMPTPVGPPPGFQKYRLDAWVRSIIGESASADAQSATEDAEEAS